MVGMPPIPCPSGGKTGGKRGAAQKRRGGPSGQFGLLLSSTLVASLTLVATYAGVISVLLANQVAAIDPARKVANLAFVTSVAFAFTLFVPPIVGALSDRTRSRFGRRSPWMLGGAVVGALLLIALGWASSLTWIVVLWTGAQMALNAFQAPFTAIVADRFPRSRRGIASAASGFGVQVGAAVGVVIAGVLAERSESAYLAFAVAIAVVAVLFVTINRDHSSLGLRAEPFRFKSALSVFWVNPRAHPDFAWVFGARLLFTLGHYLVLAFQLFILIDYVGLPQSTANGVIGLLAVLSLCAAAPTILVAGWWSDRVRKRKPFIYFGSLIITLGLLIPILTPTVSGMIALSICNGVGYAIYDASDSALMTEVLPANGNRAGKDLGIFNLATNIPQAVAPVLGAAIIAWVGYEGVFALAAAAVLGAAVMLVPVKSVT
ncbi:MFS transporter [Leifsonia sp. NPDC102414]|uniref:MFS transporter n=1 Tax=Leifsonia sp. NPDC102414 TaxID=3364124 RepID=UPI0038205813